MKQPFTSLRISLFRGYTAWKISWLVCLLFPGVNAQSEPAPNVFSGPPSDYAADVMKDEASSATNVLRTLHVEERAGIDRNDELVRVPLFFAEAECPTLDDLAIIEDVDNRPDREMPWQADDIRLGPDGGISRVHLWFSVNLKAGEKRSYQVVRHTGDERKSVRPTPPPMELEATSSELRVSTERGPFIWNRTGELRSLPLMGSEWRFDSSGAFPRVLIKFPARGGQPAADVVLDRTSTEREVTWSGGPLFTKIRVRVSGADGVSLEQDYRIPRHGREVVVTSTFFPGDRTGGVVRENRLLQGTPGGESAAPASIARVPAGIRYALRAEHAYVVTALSNQRGAILAVPLVIGGSNGTWAVDKNGGVSLHGMRGLRRGGEGEKDTLNAFWTEVRLVPSKDTDPDQLWETYRQQVQPLVAVVEEPGASVNELHAALRALVREMKPVGWRQNAGRARVMGDLKRVTKILEESPTVKDQDPELLRRSARGARAKLTNDGARKLREDEKGRAYGLLDPYHITYTQSAAAALAVLDNAPPQVTAANYAMAKAVRDEGGRIDPAGFPYIDCFSRNLNMQLGPILFGLTAGKAKNDTALVRFYRDLATSPPVQAVFGRGQRPYTGAPTTKADQTDYLYQAICDFWLRASELLAGENLGLHPLAYSRYTDCVDVMADVYHGVAAQDKPGAAGQARANFYRGQAHTHRWLGWSCAPYIRLLEDPAEKASIGLTEAIHHSQAMKGRWKNWPDLTYYVLADLLVREGLDRSTPVSLPPTPGDLNTNRIDASTELSWAPVNQAAEYRVYKGRQSGGPFRWLNSTYLDAAASPTDQPRFTDNTATANATYVVLAVDAEGRESAWPESSSSYQNQQSTD